MVYFIPLRVFYFLVSECERSQSAYVTFKDPQSAETAVLLSVCKLSLILAFCNFFVVVNVS